MTKPFAASELTAQLQASASSLLITPLDVSAGLPVYGKMVAIHPGSTRATNLLVALPDLPIAYIDTEGGPTPRVSLKTDEETKNLLAALYAAAGFDPPASLEYIRLRMKFYSQDSIIVAQGIAEDGVNTFLPSSSLEVGGSLRPCVTVSTCAYETTEGVKYTITFGVYKAYYQSPQLRAPSRNVHVIEF